MPERANKIPVAVLGATGVVGQRFVQRLCNHPWFELVVVAASDQSAGRLYQQACRLLGAEPIPPLIGGKTVLPVTPGPAFDAVKIIFSALPSEIAGNIEAQFAHRGFAVCSNASAHRMDEDVPLLVPDVNPHQTSLIEKQQKQRSWKGLIVCNPNCSSTQLVVALKPLQDAFEVSRLMVVTMQAISGAGYPGIASLDILGNLLPYIDGEEEKMEIEPNKILGTNFRTSAQCNRVPVREGHTECVSVEFCKKANIQAVQETLASFRPPAEAASLPSTPEFPIVVHRSPHRPQPLLDGNLGNGMSVSVGRVRPCPLFDTRFVILGHNTIRGAAGGAIHNAELLVQQGWIQ